MALGNVRGSRRNVKEIFLGRFHILDKTVSPALVEMLDPARKHLRNRTFPFGRSDRHVFRPDLLPTAFFGQGIGSGTQSAGDFLPEQWTDFIFAVLCEELGFIGASVILIMFGVLLYRGIKIAMTSRDFYGSLVAIGVVTMFFFHVFENVGMNIGIMPIAGIPLPFISYGGSAVLANFMGIALLENIYMRRESLSFRE